MRADAAGEQRVAVEQQVMRGDGRRDVRTRDDDRGGRAIPPGQRPTPRLTWPRAETATDFISMAADPDLTAATKIAIQEMVDFLTATKGMTKQQAYQLVSMAGNVAITQLVDKPNLGVHVRLPKSIFKK